MGFGTDILIETGELAERLDDPSSRVFNCAVLSASGLTGSRSALAASIGKRRTSREATSPTLSRNSRMRGLLLFMLPSTEALAQAMSAHGVEDGTRVVVYDSRGSKWAARVWWFLRAFGFGEASVLNGGWKKWALEGRHARNSEHSMQTTLR